MPPAKIGENTLSWLPEAQIGEGARNQISNLAGLPFIFKHVAVMPDCHYGLGGHRRLLHTHPGRHYSGGSGCGHRVRRGCSQHLLYSHLFARRPFGNPQGHRASDSPVGWPLQQLGQEDGQTGDRATGGQGRGYRTPGVLQPAGKELEPAIGFPGFRQSLYGADPGRRRPSLNIPAFRFPGYRQQVGRMAHAEYGMGSLYSSASPLLLVRNPLAGSRSSLAFENTL